MSNENREQRLWKELDGLRKLKKRSSIFDFDFEGDPPDKFTLTFKGKGLVRDETSDEDVAVSEFHQVQLQMAYLYPEREPDLKWITPIFHPNLSNSGFVELEDIGLTWDENLSLDIICERIWDVVRLAHLDLDSSTQMFARDWFSHESTFKLPLDARPLRDKEIQKQSNIIQYSRRSERKSPRKLKTVSTEEVLYIGDDLGTQNARSQRTVVSEKSKNDSSIKPTQPVNPPNLSSNDDGIQFVD